MLNAKSDLQSIAQPLSGRPSNMSELSKPDIPVLRKLVSKVSSSSSWWCDSQCSYNDSTEHFASNDFMYRDFSVLKLRQLYDRIIKISLRSGISIVPKRTICQ
jgi:hypothetical protein